MKSKLDQKFIGYYNQLNIDQKKAVDIIEGAVLVIASPGSGKTQILSLRVANILKLSDVSASNILCLTFTDSATKNMQDRLANVIGAEAYEVHINTFHSFCSGVINQYPEKFVEDFGVDASPADDFAQFEIMQEILINLPLSNPLSKQIPDQGWVYIGDCQKAISNLKKGGLSPDLFWVYLKLSRLEIDSLTLYMNQILFVLKISLRGKESVSKFRLDFEIILNQLNNLSFDLDTEIVIRLLKQRKVDDQNIKSVLISIDNLQYPTFGKFFVQTLNQAWLDFNDDVITITDLKNICKSFWTVDINNNKILKETKSYEKHIALVEVYYNYNLKMKDRRLFDFDDMILSVNQKIQTDPELCYILAEKFQYILVDEFQDTSGVQLNLIKNLCIANNTNQSANIMVVCDDDQSIYKFQGASTFNIINFKDSFDADFVSLKINYRSSRLIVDTSRLLANNITDGIVAIVPEIQKDISAFNHHIDSTINYSQFDSINEEISWISSKIKLLLDSGVQASDIAIICAKHKNLISIVESLDYHKIAFNYERGNNVLLDPKINQLMVLMQYVASFDGKNFERDDLLPLIFGFDCFGISSLDLYQLGLALKYKNWSKSLFEIVNDYITTTGLSYGSTKTSDSIFPLLGIAHNNFWIKPQILDLFLFLLDLGKKSKQDPGEKIIDYLIGADRLDSGDDKNDEQDKDDNELIDYGYVSKFKKAYFNKFWDSESSKSVRLLSMLKTFVDKIRGFGQGKILYLSEIVAKLELYQQQKSLSIIDKSSFAVGSDSVSVLTSHKAKGLEFEYVFVVNCNQNTWCGKGFVDKLSLPVYLPIKSESENTSDKLRNFYVALTRAKKHLYLSSYSNNDGKSENKLVFLDYIADNWTTKSIIQDPKLQEQALLLATKSQIPNIILDYDQKLLLEGSLQNYKLSVTHLNNFLDMSKGGPKFFLDNNLLQFPATRSKHASYGSAVHNALNHIYTLAIVNNHKPDLSVLLDSFKIALSKEVILHKDKQQLWDEGVRHLTKFWEMKVLEANYMTEKSFSYGVNVNDCILSGNIDKMVFDYDNRTAIVVDYKTGIPGRPKDYTRATRGKYSNEFKDFRFLKNYNQLVFYKLLVENSKDFKNRFWVKQGILEFVNCHQNPEELAIPTVQLDISDEEAQYLTKLITAIWKRIKSLDFEYPTNFEANYEGTLAWADYLVNNG